jgi:hypothetical protein
MRRSIGWALFAIMLGRRWFRFQAWLTDSAWRG